ncbi:MAG TPA: M20 family metallo-hydrolase [Chitinophagaceae bacterium]|jgi:acetylornithine deacetylase
METAILYDDAVGLLKQLIATPSLSREEDATATLIETFLRERNVPVHRYLNNIWCRNRYFDPAKPVVLLNSHHDTVKPNPQYTKDPFAPLVEDGKLYGLGSNDAGGALVSLIATFLYFFDQKGLRYNIVLAATAEEEISGTNGIEALLPHHEFLQTMEGASLSFAIVGEPTLTNLAIAEKGLLVLDCTAHGKAGHAAREEGENAIYKAMKDIDWFRNFVFPQVSPCLGPVKMSVTVIQTENKAHNVVPAVCSFVVDVRVTDAYTHEEVLDIIRRYTTSDIKPRSMRMRSSKIDMDHSIVRCGLKLGKTTYGSPTTSDQALIPVPSLKCGPGDSARSHTADEFIYLDEVKQGIETYIQLLNGCIV